MIRDKCSETEQEHHRQAFEFYSSLGLKRTYKVVADKYSVSISTIKNWSRRFRWRDRIAEREAAITRRLAQKALQGGAEESERDLRIVRAALMRFAKDIADGKIKTRMQDLEKLISLERRLLGIPESTVDQHGKPSGGSVVIYLPDNGRDPNKRAPVSNAPEKRDANDTHD